MNDEHMPIIPFAADRQTANSMPTVETGGTHETVATDRMVGRFPLSIEEEIEAEVGINNPISKLKRDEFDNCQYFNQNDYWNQNNCILFRYGYFNTSFMIFSLVGFWSSVVLTPPVIMHQCSH